MKTLALLSLGLLVAMGCTYTVHTVQPTAYQAQGYVTVNSAPPPLRADVTPAARPRADAYWVAGHWSWEGRWVWVAGQWQAPRAGYVWQEPVAAQAGTGYRYYPGYWRRGSQRPPAVYQRPGTIRVAVRPPARYGAPPRQGVVVQQPGRRPQRPGVVVQRPGRRPQRPGVVVQRPGRRPQRPGVVVQPARPRPARPTQRPGVVVRPANPRPARPTQRPGVVQPTQLRCRIGSSVVPRGGLLTITGSGLSGATVRIGGIVSPVVSNTDRMIQAQAAGGSGAVTVAAGGRRANCGNVRVMGR